jgi:hypothetical protein
VLTCRDEGFAPDLVERVLDFSQAIRRIDVDENQSRLRGCVLSDQPFTAVGGPNAYPVAWAQPQAQQRRTKAVNALLQLRVSPAHVLVARDER